MSELLVSIETTEAGDVHALLLRHLELMRDSSPEESCHVMDPHSLSENGVVLFGVRQAGELLAVGGLRQLSPDHAELKSMHTASKARGRGAGHSLLVTLIDHATEMGMSRLSLETGRAALFVPARRLYSKHGFEECAPFGSYISDPFSLFMTLEI